VGLRAIFWSLTTVAFVALVIVLGMYFYVFAPGHWLELSRNPGDWERFGTYVGGMLGPIYALLAIGGVLITIAVQREQTTLDQLAGMLARNADSIDAILAREPVVLPPAARARAESVGMRGFSVQMLIAALSSQALTPPSADSAVQAYNEALTRELTPALVTDTALVAIELQNLVRCLRQYATVAGTNAPLIRLYTDRYRPIVVRIYVLKLLDTQVLQEHFRPQDYVETLRPRRA
jgi:hypothetical protein